jgi:hypothetical protein
VAIQHKSYKPDRNKTQGEQKQNDKNLMNERSNLQKGNNKSQITVMTEVIFLIRHSNKHSKTPIIQYDQ